jgi:hypothetical protein
VLLLIAADSWWLRSWRIASRNRKHGECGYENDCFQDRRYVQATKAAPDVADVASVGERCFSAPASK